CGNFLSNSVYQQLHQTIHFITWPVPVLSTKCIQGEIFNSQLRGALNNITYALHTMKVPEQTVMPTFLCPAPVSIHNNGDVFRQIPKIYAVFCSHELLK